MAKTDFACRYPDLDVIFPFISAGPGVTPCGSPECSKFTVRFEIQQTSERFFPTCRRFHSCAGGLIWQAAGLGQFVSGACTVCEIFLACPKRLPEWRNHCSSENLLEA